MPDKVWYTANPTCQGLDVYPKWASRELTTAYASFLEDPEVHANQVYHFGDRFFGATIRFFANGCHQQTTTSGGLTKCRFSRGRPRRLKLLWVPGSPTRRLVGVVAIAS